MTTETKKVMNEVRICKYPTLGASCSQSGYLEDTDENIVEARLLCFPCPDNVGGAAPSPCGEHGCCYPGTRAGITERLIERKRFKDAKDEILRLQTELTVIHKAVDDWCEYYRALWHIQTGSSDPTAEHWAIKQILNLSPKQPPSETKGKAVRVYSIT